MDKSNFNGTIHIVKVMHKAVESIRIRPNNQLRVNRTMNFSLCESGKSMGKKPYLCFFSILGQMNS